jgi:hypothetical protein
MSGDPRLGRDPGDDPPRWVRVWLPVLTRITTFAAGGVMAIRPDASEAHIAAGSGLMLAAASLAVVRWMGPRP